MQSEEVRRPYDKTVLPSESDNELLPLIKPEDMTYFSPLLAQDKEEDLTTDEVKERKIMMLLLKVKNGTPPMRKQALRLITEKARDFGAGPLFQ